MPPVELNLDDPYKKVYTEDENTRAYRIFSMIDLDGSGYVTLREIERILTGGERDRLLTETFLDGDTGIVFGLDEQNCPIIERIDDHSPANDLPALLPGLRIRNVCGTDIPQNDRSSLNVITKVLLKESGKNPIVISFQEPLLVINKYSYCLDIDIDCASATNDSAGTSFFLWRTCAK